MALDSPHNALRQPPPPLQRGQTTCPLWQGLGTTHVTFILLERSVNWWGLHYVDDRWHPCLRSVGLCKPCADRWECRRTGFIGAMRKATGGRYILRITEYAYNRCPVLAVQPINLRGLMLDTMRLADHKHAPWRIALSMEASGRSVLPDAPDTVAVMSHIWGVDLRRIEQAPPGDGDLSPFLKPYRKDRRQT